MTNRRTGTAGRQSPAGRYAGMLAERPAAFMLLESLLLNLLIESMARLDFFGGLDYLRTRPLPFLLNTLLLFATLSVSLLFRRRAFVLAILTAGWTVLGITNAALTALRASPLSGIDFAILRSCLPILRVYLRGWHVLLILLFLTGIGVLVALTFRRAGKYAVRWEREVLLFAAGVLLFAGGVLSVRTDAEDPSFTDLPGAYEDYGFVTCFSLTVLERGIPEPEDYSAAMTKAIAAALDGEETSGEFGALKGESPPNLVAVQLESFMDPLRFRDTVYSEDPAPVFRALKNRYPSGRMRVNTVGAGTANTEFEVLTGISLEYFGAGEYPYQTILEERDAVCESAASDVRAAGYAAHAVHNHSGSFYDRHKVYAALGFETFTPLEYMNGVEKNPLGWARDTVLTDVIGDCLDATGERDFVFAVSVQGHGLYPAEDDGSGPVRITEMPADRTEEEQAQLVYYINQVKEMDRFLGELIDALEKRAETSGEKTLLLLYGDHLPPFLYDRDSFRDGSDELDSEYVIVPVGYPEGAAEGIPDRDLEAWQAGMRLLCLAGVGDGLVNRCHRILGETDGFENAVRILAYDMLYGERYAWNGELPFKRGTLGMGVRPPEILSAEAKNGTLAVRGKNLTPSSVVSVNGWPVRTAFVSPELLTTDWNADPGDRITVLQRSEDYVVFGETEAVLCRAEAEEGPG